MTIYVITNKINGKQYVGQTIQTLKNRWQFHISKGSRCVALKSAIDKYGKENFTIEMVYEAKSLDELNEREIEFINKFNTLTPNGYNLKTGGNRPIYSDESRKKMSKSSMGRTPWNKGLTAEDPRVAASVRCGKDSFWYGKEGVRKGKKNSPEHIRKFTEKMTGRTLSKEHKIKISEANSVPKPYGFSETMSKVKDSIKVKIICDQNGQVYESISLASKVLGVNPGHIQRIINGTLKQSKGYTFKKV